MNRALLLATFGIGLLCVTDMMVKWASPFYPTFQIAFLRYFFGTFGSLVLLARARPGWPSRETIRANSIRSVLVALTTTTFFFALSTLPFAETVALSFLSPLFIVLLGTIVLGEKFEARVLVALVLGFIGMIVLVGGQIGLSKYGSRAQLGAIAAVASAVAYASNMVFLRARATRDAVVTIVFFQNIGPAVILLIPALMVWTSPTLRDVGIFAVLGLLGVGSHLLLSMAYAKAEAARLASVEYTALLWAAILGYIAFNEVPGLSTLVGAVLIAVGTIVTGRK
jgi:drug/metabolite transporter (DMT)-like permease